MLLVRKMFIDRKLIIKDIIRHDITEEEAFNITNEIASKFESRLNNSNIKYKDLVIDEYFDCLKISFKFYSLDYKEFLFRLTLIYIIKNRR